MLVRCDGCGRMVDDRVCQIAEEGKEILYVCPDCFLQRSEGHGPESQP